MPLSSPPAAPQRGDRATFAQRVDAFITWLIGFVSELNIFSANLNSIAAGGAYAIPYRYSSNPDVIANGGYFTFPNPNTTTDIYFDTSGLGGAAVANLIVSALSSSSAVKAQVRITAVLDPSRFFVREITSFIQGDGYIRGTSTGVSGSATSIAEGELVIVHLQRTGDKGDTGAAAKFPILWVRDEKSSGTSGSTVMHASGAGNVRTLNTVTRNEISGASLSSNRVTLPAGQYRFKGHAPAGGVGVHQALIFNVTANGAHVYGSSERSDGSFNTRSLFMGDFTIVASTTFELRHYLGSTSGSLGYPANSGANEVYSELIFEKVA